MEPSARLRNPNDCPRIENHTSHPLHYAAHMMWAERMLKTHNQKRCPDCGFWCIWTKKLTHNKET